MKRIAALELFGTLLLVRHLIAKKEAPNCRTILLLASENQGNVYSLLKEAAKKPITAVIANPLAYPHQPGGPGPPPCKERVQSVADELTH